MNPKNISRMEMFNFVMNTRGLPSQGETDELIQKDRHIPGEHRSDGRFDYES